MRIEHLVVGITHDGLVAIFAKKRHIVFITKVDNLLVNAFAPHNRDTLPTVVGHEINRTLDGVEVPLAVSADNNSGRARARTSGFGRKSPAVLISNSFEAITTQHFRIDQNVVRLSVFKQVVVQLDRSGVAADDNRIEMKAVG